MSMKIEKIDVWTGEIADRVGGLAETLEPLVKSGADFSFLIGRRQPDKPGTGVVFIGGISGAKQAKAAQAAGIAKSGSITALRLESADKPGLVQKIAAKLALAGISLRGVSASVIGTKCAIILAFDGSADRDKAAKLLRD